MVNVKKSNGGSESEYEDLKKYAIEDRLEIKRELKLYNLISLYVGIISVY